MFLLLPPHPEPGRPAGYVGHRPPTLEPERTLPVYRALEQAMGSGLVRSAATPGRGGLAVCLARAALAGGLGASLDLDACPGADGLEPDLALFGESNGRFLVSVAAGDEAAFAELFAGLPCAAVGAVGEAPRLLVHAGGEALIDADLDSLRQRFKEGLAGA